VAAACALSAVLPAAARAIAARAVIDMGTFLIGLSLR
jgi:hypothetical protein